MIKHLRNVLAPLLLAVVAGCANTPVPAPDLSHYSTPPDGMSGVYFYQWKTGVLGSLYDVRFVLNGDVLTKINTGQWSYFDVPAGTHQVRITPSLTVPLTFVAGNNYFFKGMLNGGAPVVIWEYNEQAVNEAIQNIESGRYKKIDPK